MCQYLEDLHNLASYFQMTNAQCCIAPGQKTDQWALTSEKFNGIILCSTLQLVYKNHNLSSFDRVSKSIHSDLRRS